MKKIADSVMVNLGCGARTHPEWINIDYSRETAIRQSKIVKLITKTKLIKPDHSQYLNYDLRRGLPFQECQVDVVYHSHFLEHLDREVVPNLIRDIFRVLRPGGIHRVVVPDLAYIVQCYQDALSHCNGNDTEAEDKYDLAMIELFDQMVRTTCGGHKQVIINNKLGILEKDESKKRGWKNRIKMAIGLSSPNNPFFSGELHRWMYDKYSLPRLLMRNGFSEIRCVSHDESAIPLWESFQLDSKPDGNPYKQNSLYVECIKPENGKNDPLE